MTFPSFDDDLDDGSHTSINFWLPCTSIGSFPIVFVCSRKFSLIVLPVCSLCSFYSTPVFLFWAQTGVHTKPFSGGEDRGDEEWLSDSLTQSRPFRKFLLFSSSALLPIIGFGCSCQPSSVSLCVRPSLFSFSLPTFVGQSELASFWLRESKYLARMSVANTNLFRVFWKEK